MCRDKKTRGCAGGGRERKRSAAGGGRKKIQKPSLTLTAKGKMAGGKRGTHVPEKDKRKVKISIRSRAQISWGEKINTR